MRTRRAWFSVAAVVVLLMGLATVVTVASADAATTVMVTPSTGLAGGQTVAVGGSGLTPGATAGWCQAAVAPEGATPSENWCGVGVNGTGPVGMDGSFGGPLRLHRFIYVPALAEWVDCTATPCASGAADLADIAGTGVGVPIEFAPPPPPPDTRGTVSLSVSTDVHPGQEVTVTGSGFRSGALIDLFQCFPGAGAPAAPSSCGLLRASVTADPGGGFSDGLSIEQVVTDAPALVGQGGTTYDCLAAPSGPCRVVAAEAVDFPGTAAASPVSMALPPPPPPVVLPGVASVPEGNSATTSLQVPLTLSTTSTQTVTVLWTTLYASGAPSNQADPATDYTPTSGTITFAPGETSKTVTIQVNGDTLVEPDEYVVVSFHDPTNAVMGGYWGLGFGVILNDDRATVLPGGGVVTAPTTGTADLTVSLTLTNPSTLPVTVQWTTLYVPGAPDSTYGPQAPTSDYTPVSGTVTFNPGDTAADVHVPVTGSTYTPAEYVIVSFTAPTNAHMGGFLGLGFGFIVPAP
jgi:hypothetical protein